MKIDMDFIRIAFVGTPGAGKTSVLKTLKENVFSSGFTVGFIDEAATVIMHDGANQALRASDPVAFQEKVAITQLFSEDRELISAISRGDKKYLQITDRALPDAYVYLKHDQREELRLPLPSIEELNARYDAVIFFEFFDFGTRLKRGNELRAEQDVSDIKRVCERSLRVYSKHKRFYSVSPCDSIRTKAAKVAEIINEVAGETVFSIS